MGLIQLPQRQLTQPQYAAELDPLHWAFKDIVFAFSAGRGFTDGKHPKLAGTLTTFTTFAPGQKGKYLQNTVAGNNAFFANSTDHDTLGGVTILGLVQPSSVSGQMTVASKDAGGGGTNTPFCLMLDAGGVVSLNRANSGFRVWNGVAGIAAGQIAVVAATQGSDIGVAPKFYIDGQFDTGSPVNQFGGSGSGAPNSTTEGIKLTANTSFNNRFLGGIYGVLVLNKEYSASQVAELSRNLWAIWKAPARRIFLTPSASSDGVGSASGTSTVSGVGVSDNAQPGSSAGTSTVSGIGASTANAVAASSGTGAVSGIGAADFNAVGAASGSATVDGVGTSSTGSSGSASGTCSVSGVGASAAASDGVANGVASVSGIGASEALSTGAASGTSTVSGVGDSVQAGSAVGGASGTSTVSGVSASVVASVGSASGDCSVYGVGAKTGGEVDAFSGGYLYDDTRESHAERRKKQRIKLGIIEEEKPVSHVLPNGLERFEISSLVDEKPVLPNTKKQHIPARQQKKLAEQEAENAELKMLLQLEVEREEEAILRFLMEL